MSPIDITADADADAVVDGDTRADRYPPGGLPDPELVAIVGEATRLQELAGAWSHLAAGERSSAPGAGNGPGEGVAVTIAAMIQGVAESMARLVRSTACMREQLEQLRGEIQELRHEVERLAEAWGDSEQTGSPAP
jgi:hypothetical protein